MNEIGVLLLPPDLASAAAIILLFAAAITALVTTAFGLGGGVLLLGVMTVFLPVMAVIPLHGVIQAGNNGWRTLLLWRHIRWPIFLSFLAGGVLGAAAGSQILVNLSEAWLEIVLGAFILYSCWGPMPHIAQGSRVMVATGGAATGALTLFIGATGPLVAALLRAMRLDRFVHMGTFSACMVLQHGLKIAVFGLLGFGFGPYLPLLAGMLLCGLLGTLLGRYVLERLNNRVFRLVLTAALTVLAVRLLHSGLTHPDLFDAIG